MALLRECLVQVRVRHGIWTSQEAQWLGLQIGHEVEQAPCTARALSLPDFSNRSMAAEPIWKRGYVEPFVRKPGATGMLMSSVERCKQETSERPWVCRSVS